MSSRIKVPSFSPSIKRVLIISPLFFGTFLFGMFGLHLTEWKPLFESFFLTVTTVSTVGYGDGMTSAGRMVVIIVILCSMTIVAYTFGTVLRAIIEGELSQSLGRHKLEKAVSSPSLYRVRIRKNRETDRQRTLGKQDSVCGDR